MVRLQNQENRCMVEVDIKNNIEMHDHLRDLGRNIVSKNQYLQQMTYEQDHGSMIYSST